MEPNKRISEYVTVILGGLGTFLVVVATLTAVDLQGWDLLGILLILFYQFGIAMVALPFLIKSFRRERIIPWFARIVSVEIILNGLLVVVQTILIFRRDGLNSDNYNSLGFFAVVALLEVFPIIFYFQNKDRIYGEYV